MGTASTIEQNVVSSIEEVIFKLFSFFFLHNIVLQWGQLKDAITKIATFFVCLYKLPVCFPCRLCPLGQLMDSLSTMWQHNHLVIKH